MFKASVLIRTVYWGSSVGEIAGNKSEKVFCYGSGILGFRLKCLECDLLRQLREQSLHHGN